MLNLNGRCGGLRVLAAAVSWLLLTGAWTGVTERTEDYERRVTAVIGAVRENTVSILFGKKRDGVIQEMPFARVPGIEVIHKKWEQIAEGEPVKVTFIERVRIREGRNEKGVLDTEFEVVSRTLKTLEFAPPSKKKLISGL